MLKINQNSLFQDPSKAVDLTKLATASTLRRKRSDRKREVRDLRGTTSTTRSLAPGQA